MGEKPPLRVLDLDASQCQAILCNLHGFHEADAHHRLDGAVGTCDGPHPRCDEDTEHHMTRDGVPWKTEERNIVPCTEDGRASGT